MLYCPKCSQELSESDNFCRRCGRALKPGTGFWYTHCGIILLALVLGPFALIPLYLSKMMGTAAKTVYCVLILLFTLYLGFVCWQVFTLMKEMMDAALPAVY